MSETCRNRDPKPTARDPNYRKRIPHPDDRLALQAELEENDDFRAAMIDAHGIDERLPKIIYLRRHRKSLRAIASECGMSHETVDNVLRKLTHNLLRDCGL